MRRFGVLLASAALGAALAASGPALAFGGGHMGGGFGGGGFHGGGFGGGGFHGGGFGGGHFGGFAGRSMAMGWRQSRLQSWHVYGPERGDESRLRL